MKSIWHGKWKSLFLDHISRLVKQSISLAKKLKVTHSEGKKKETPFNFLTLLYYYALEPKSCFSNSFRNKILFSFSAEHCCTACLSTIKKAYFKKNQTPNSRKIKLKKGNIRRKFSTRMNIMGLLR